MALAIAIVSGFLTVLVLFLLQSLFTWRRQSILDRLRAVAEEKARTQGREAFPAHAGKSGVPVKRRRMVLPGMQVLGSVFSRGYLERLKVNLTKAGVPLKPEELAGMSLAGGVGGAVVGLVLGRTVLMPSVLSLGGFAWPFAWVNLSKRRRTQKLEGQLVDALTLISNSLRAGHSFMQALELVSRDMAPPLAPELSRALKESRVGLSLDDALTGIVERFESRDLELVVTGVLVQRQIGGNLAQVLDNIASTIDKRIKARAKVRALTAQGRMSAWVISIMPFALAFLVFGAYPEFGRVMLAEPLGVIMLAVAGVLLAIGIALVRKVVAVDV